MFFREILGIPVSAIRTGASQILRALVSFTQMAGDAPAALGYAEQLAIVTPDDKELAEVILKLRSAATPRQ